jgi:hypothetical protein
MGKTAISRTQAKDGFDAAYKRICMELNINTQVELAAVLDIRQSSVSDAKRRDAIPAEWQLSLFEQYGLLPLWVRSGEGPKRMGDPGSVQQYRGNLDRVQTLFADFTRNASAAMGLRLQA